MNAYCPDCGSSLAECRKIDAYWLRVLRCTQCTSADFIEVDDMRWIYPLLRLEAGVRQKVEKADINLIELAAQRIRRIDYKTVSIVDFEYTILGCFDPKRRYQVIYPDGSEK